VTRALTEEQLRVLHEARKATDHMVGLRVSYWPGGRSLERRGLVVKRGVRARLWFITDAGREVLANYRDVEGRAVAPA
jgi:hypothetical protein